MENAIKNCPMCKMPTFKDGGCNYMKCSNAEPFSNCPCEWCWVCELPKYKVIPGYNSFCDDKTHNSH